ncbi:MAG: pectate lyase [Chitinophagaceae bacterium]|nr:pectate lyase [Chitinophagaceae bacterium]MBK8310177.1 pectate lyase [Chitinophagaceae bacterium]MBP6476980.1 pectate lyase [Chitinophagaceae bacterium]MBP7107878.1 pectate lyase [Chitinophagaceae bacterium]MBP7313960.1 pectate lyase [Chitinophagaceae bacterium]
MKKVFLFLNTILLFMLVSCAQQNKIAVTNTNETAIAFPGAEGFGKYATGGRGGKILIVSNLNDAGEGSFRKAAIANGKRIIVFAISGTIHLNSPLSIKGDITIAGQTAPGDGICIADYPVGLSGNNIIIRYLRFRMGDKNQNKGMVPGSGHDDALSASRRSNIIIDHCSISWSTDECFSVYGGDSTTLQWNLISEPLNYSYHFEEGDKDFENHGYGGIWGGSHLSAHHNLFAHCVSRNPRFNGTRLGATKEFVDFRNNVIYNWGGNSSYGGEAGNYNMINNYYKYGPSTNKNVKFRIVNPTKTDALDFGKFYVNGNYVDGAKDVTKNNWLGIQMGNGGTEADKKEAVIDNPFSTEQITEQSAVKAYEEVLKFVGASYKRDTLDERIISDVKNRTGRFIDVQGGFPHGTAYELTMNAWPVLKSLPAHADTDKDGMPDDWEKKNGLNPIDPSDASQNKLDKHYTNVEVYINSIVK